MSELKLSLEQKEIIRDFYKKNYEQFRFGGGIYLASGVSDSEYSDIAECAYIEVIEVIMSVLQIELEITDESLNEHESELCMMLSKDQKVQVKEKHMYSKELINVFENVLKEVIRYKMTKYAIRLYKNDSHAHLIFHATPDLTDYSWRWYVTDKKDKIGKLIEGQPFESFTTTTELIKERGSEGLYLYCEYTDLRTNRKYKTEFVRLYADINKIIDSNTYFDNISNYDEKGMIISTSSFEKNILEMKKFSYEKWEDKCVEDLKEWYRSFSSVTEIESIVYLLDHVNEKCYFYLLDLNEDIISPYVEDDYCAVLDGITEM